MSTIIYLANQNIQILEGTPGTKSFTVKQAFTVEAPEGSIINGMIMDTELFVPFMKETWESHKLPNKDAILVISSTQFMGRKLELPKLSEKQTLAYIEREFAELTRGEESIYGYVPLSIEKNNKNNQIYAEAIRTEFVNDYIEIFNEIGVTLKAVHSGESSMIGLTNVIVGKQYKTFALELIDNMTINTLLWVDGSFYSFTSSRCFTDPGTLEHCADVARAVSQILQFMQANQIESRLECVMLAGINELDLAMYQRELEQQNMLVPAQMLDTKMLVQAKLDPKTYVRAASGLIINGKAQNFLNQYKQKKSAAGQNSELRKAVVIIGSVFLVMMIAFIVSYVIRFGKESENKKLVEYQEDPMVMMDIAEYRVQQAKYNFLVNQYNAIKDIDRNIYSYPICDKDVVALIDSCAKGYASVQFESFDAEQGTANVIAKADTVEDINKFIKRLNEEDIFKKVDYTGYSYDESTKLWDIHVMCTLQESAGRDPSKNPDAGAEDDSANGDGGVEDTDGLEMDE